MILTGQMDSPFVRRVAVALNHYGMAYERNVISAYGDFSDLLALNPLGKVPALALDEGTVLADSTLILDHLDRLAGTERALLPADPETRAPLLAHMGVAVGLAEKAVEYRTETVRRPADNVDAPRVERILAQIAASLAWLEARTPAAGFVSGSGLTHGDIASAVTMTFIVNKNPEHLESGFPKLTDHRERCEVLDAFAVSPFEDG